MRFPGAVVCLVALAAFWGCDSTSPTASGTLKVSVVTTGGDWDLDGYEVLVDGKAAASIGTLASVELTSLSIGSHSVELGGLAGNCSVTGLNRRSVGVNGGETTEVAFAVLCMATGVRVSLNGTGVDFGPTTYQLSVDGAPPLSLGFLDAVTVTYLAPGTHTVGLSPAPPANCTLSPDPTVEAEVAEGAVTAVVFGMTCTALTGVVEVTATTGGEDIDLDGYQLTIDGAGNWTLATNGVQRVPSLSPGDHLVEISGLADNCTLTGEAARTLTLTAGTVKRDTARTDFDVSCAPLPKSVHLTVTTTGTDLDDGYTLRVDQECYEYWYGYEWCNWNYSTSLVANDEASFDLAPGTHEFLLLGVADNCTVTGDNPRSATTAEGTTLEVAFQVTCTAPTTLRVTALTSGIDFPAFYNVQVDGVLRGTVPTTGTPVSFQVGAGAHAIELSGLPGNCSVNGANPVYVNIPAAVTTDVGFTVTCQPLGAVRISAPTTGDDPDSYYFGVVDGGAGYSFPSTGSALISAAPGLHIVELKDIAPNCAATGPNPVQVSVTSSNITDVVMPVTCAPNPTLRVTITTTGTNLDPGYVIGVDPYYYWGDTYSLAVGNNGVYEMRLPPGGHVVYLREIAGNCSLTGTNGVYVNLTMGAITDLALNVTCN